MAKNRFQYTRGPVDTVALMIVCAWLGIWVLWDRGESEWRGRGISPTRIVYVSDKAVNDLEEDLIFIRRHDGALANRAEDRVVNASISIPIRPRMLENSLVRHVGKLDRASAGLVQSAQSALTAYMPAWRDSGIYRLKEGQEGSFLVAMSQRLQDCGFELPINLFEGVEEKEGSWQARVHVDCGVNGRPRHVFLEEASENAEINNWLVRTMYQGSMGVTGATCSGWITVGQRRP